MSISPKKDRLKVSFSNSTLRFRMVVSNTIVRSHGEFPVALLSQINNKLISMVKDKSIAEFEIYSQQLKDTWNLIKSGDFSDTKSIVIDVAQGVPNLKGVNLKNAKESRYVCKLTLNDREEVAKWENSISMDR